MRRLQDSKGLTATGRPDVAFSDVATHKSAQVVGRHTRRAGSRLNLPLDAGGRLLEPSQKAVAAMARGPGSQHRSMAYGANQRMSSHSCLPTFRKAPRVATLTWRPPSSRTNRIAYLLTVRSRVTMGIEPDRESSEQLSEKA